jgi:hypothetical protein
MSPAMTTNHFPVLTLGSMVGGLRAHAASWRLAIPDKDGSGDIAPLLAMIGLL